MALYHYITMALWHNGRAAYPAGRWGARRRLSKRPRHQAPGGSGPGTRPALHCTALHCTQEEAFTESGHSPESCFNPDLKRCNLSRQCYKVIYEFRKRSGGCGANICNICTIFRSQACRAVTLSSHLDQLSSPGTGKTLTGPGSSRLSCAGHNTVKLLPAVTLGARHSLHTYRVD